MFKCRLLFLPALLIAFSSGLLLSHVPRLKHPLARESQLKLKVRSLLARFGIHLSNEYHWGFHTSPYLWKEARAFHKPISPVDYDIVKIELERVPFVNSVSEPKLSPNRAYCLYLVKPDRTKPSPWITDVLIGTERVYLWRLRVRDCISTKANWINEKLIYVEVWWGQALGTYLVLDVEAEAVIQAEMVHSGTIAFQQYQEAKQKGWMPEDLKARGSPR